MRIARRGILTLSSLYFAMMSKAIGWRAAGGITSITTHKLFGRNFFIKRDDQPVSTDVGLTGNKMRKMQYLLDLPRRPTCLVSCGGVQSNSMLAIARIANHMQSKFVYFIQSGRQPYDLHSPSNFNAAKQLGMQVIELNRDEFLQIQNDAQLEGFIQLDYNCFPGLTSTSFPPNETWWIPLGAATPEAAVGVAKLAVEIEQYIEESKLLEDWKIIVASGTGTTALFLADYFASSSRNSSRCIEVLAVPCVGDARYLREQMESLSTRCVRNCSLPTIVSTFNAPRRHFARPYKEHFEIYSALRNQTGIEFDMIYAPRTFEVLFHNCHAVHKDKSEIRMDLSRFAPECNLLYYHCGGVEGNPSQLRRYQRKKYRDS